MSTEIKEETAALYDAVVAGSSAARERMVVLNMPVVGLKVRDLLGLYPHLEYLREDLVGEGNLALVEAVVRISKGGVENTNITAYLWTAVLVSLGNFVDEELHNDSTGRTVRNHRSAGESPQPSRKAPNSEYLIGELEYDPRKEVDLLELIQGCCESDTERAIVDLRGKGYVDQEIARQLEMSLTAVYMLRREIYTRVIATGEVVAD